jgi:type 1 glutamine amidotransferase
VSRLQNLGIPPSLSQKIFDKSIILSCLPSFFYEIVGFYLNSPMSRHPIYLFWFLLISSFSWANADAELTNIKEALKGFEEAALNKVPRILVYSKASGFAHKSIPTAVKALRALAEKTKLFKPEFTTRAEDFFAYNLSNFDGLIFNNTTRVEKAFVTAEQRKVLLDFIEGGKGFAGFHGASDAGMPKWPEYTNMIGGCFDGHPWNAGGTWPFTVEDAHHPLCQSFPSRTFRFSDEIYQYKGYDRKNLRVLVSLNAKESGKEGKSLTNDYPVSWVKAYGKGRVFYTNFGHNKASWWTPFLLKHYLAGIRWSVGQIDGPIDSLALPSNG